VNVPIIGIDSVQQAARAAAMVRVVFEDEGVGYGMEYIIEADVFLDHFLLGVQGQAQIACRGPCLNP
jgi:hypothetical protein